MDASLRKFFALTQERLAAWLGIDRTTLALVETGRRALPQGRGVQDARLAMAMAGRTLDLTSGSRAIAPLPPPPIEREPVEARLDYCRHHADRLRYQLRQLRRHAAPYEARLAAVPALRAWTGPVSDPAREARWLATFEAEAMEALAQHYGAGPQRLLEARISALDHEAALLESLLAEAAAPPVSRPGE
ncbi:hypothetical protein [Hymenobacter psychrotolerans]|uniref:Helix-turn-helix n=1 Tax=Hymenobacter psychrotolerans DSM 18569 TaxID=1121959 RepID=A0A1M6Z0F3_9BACT|nr:hypothetical protein [Hymenobacter psychrotolerans]SHL24011.1 hypothetical protein SAMN02746009_02386 [Hymenobacter psychrotolerans DSM 18569]